MIVVNEGASTSTTTSADQGVVTSEPIPRKGEKVYCTYWIARGECHFAQQGCRFKHEMPDLDTLGVIMGRRSFPKWWLESIGPILAPPPHLRHAATNNRQQGKRRAITPKPLALPAPTNMHTNSNSAPTTPSIVSQAPTEGFSNMVKSPPSTLGSKFAARKDGGVDIGSHVSGASGGNMHSPVTGPSGSSNIRIPVSRPSGSNMRSSNSGPSGGNSRSSTGPSGSNARSSISGPKSNNSITQGNPPISGNSVTHGKQPVSDIRSPDDSCPSGSNMIQTKQPATNDGGFAISGAGSNTTIQTTKQSTNILTTSSPPAPQNSTSPLRIKIPLKYTPPFRVAVLPTLSSSLPSSSSSATPTVRPRVNLPLSRLQDIVSSSGFGNTNGDRNENIGAETTEGRLNDGGIAYTNTSTTTATTGDGGSSSRGSQMTRPYDDVFDLLGPFWTVVGDGLGEGLIVPWYSELFVSPLARLICLARGRGKGSHARVSFFFITRNQTLGRLLISSKGFKQPPIPPSPLARYFSSRCTRSKNKS